MSWIPDAESGRVTYIFLSHTHWDHIQGFPFSYLPTFPETAFIYSFHAGLEEVLRSQQ